MIASRRIMSQWLRVCLLSSIMLSVLTPVEVWSLSKNDIRGVCRSTHKKWTKLQGYGAFAISKSYCGYSYDAVSLLDARRDAIAACKQGSKKNKCEVVDENRKYGSNADSRYRCYNESGEAGYQACSQVIKIYGKTRWAAFAYNNRGRYFEVKGELEKALSDYKRAVALHDPNPEDTKAHKENLARVKDMLDRRKSISVEIARSTNKELCRRSLTPANTGWNESVYLYQTEVDKRRLTLEDCRVLVGAQAAAVEIDPANLTTEELCRRAVDLANSSQWGDQDRHLSFVKEAEKRQLSLNDCRKIIGLAVLQQ